jgi:hypothetical protein
MAARVVAIALCLSALAEAGSVRAEDDPACAQYHDPMTYNACLARHGPRANGVGTLAGHSRPDRVRNGEADGRALTHRLYSPQRAQRVRGRVHVEFRVE